MDGDWHDERMEDDGDGGTMADGGDDGNGFEDEVEIIIKKSLNFETQLRFAKFSNFPLKNLYAHIY